MSAKAGCTVIANAGGQHSDLTGDNTERESNSERCAARAEVTAVGGFNFFFAGRRRGGGIVFR